MKGIAFLAMILPALAYAQGVERFDREYVTSIGTGGGAFYGDVQFADDISACFGGTLAAPDYCIEYDSGNGWLQFWSTDTDGAGADGDVFTIADGTDDTTMNGDLSVAGQLYEDSLTTSTPAGTTQIIDFANGNIQKLDLEDATGDVTLTFSNPQVARYLLIIQQDGAGAARDVVWPAAVKWANASGPTISAGNDAIDVVECVYDSSASYYCGVSQDFQ